MSGEIDRGTCGIGRCTEPPSTSASRDEDEKLSAALCFKDLEIGALGVQGFGWVGAFEALHVAPSIATNDFVV
jgi:hypothetical protein